MRHLRISGGAPLIGRLTPPGDKSIAHRAGMVAAIASGHSVIENYPDSQDCSSTLACLKALGVSIRASNGVVQVAGQGLQGMGEPECPLDAGNSATTMRLLSGLLSGQTGLFILTGDESLRRRPMGRIVEPLRRMGAVIEARAGGTLPPLVIKASGPSSLRAISHSMPVASAQVKSCILFAGLYTDGVTILTDDGGSRDHTERLLAHAGADIRSEPDGSIHLHGGRPIQSFNIRLPGDPSSAAFLLAAAAAIPGSDVVARDVCMNPTRTGFIDVMKAMGANMDYVVRCDGWEPVADVRARHGRLTGTVVPADVVPRIIDEIPILSVLATQASTPSTFNGLGELRFKETDRLTATARELGKMGAKIQENTDSLIIHPSRLRGAVVDAGGDHRMAMALAVAGLMAQGESIIMGFDCASVSYPGFLEDLCRLAGCGHAELEGCEA